LPNGITGMVEVTFASNVESALLCLLIWRWLNVHMQTSFQLHPKGNINVDKTFEYYLRMNMKW